MNIIKANIGNWHIQLDFHNNVGLKISYNYELFPTIGIWWNNSGYPNEKGLHRDECAFEPIPGTSSNLNKSFTDDCFLSVEPARTLSWKVIWEIEQR